jgi:hypothetical protein
MCEDDIKVDLKEIEWRTGAGFEIRANEREDGLLKYPENILNR